MSSVVWRNLALVPEEEKLEVAQAYDESGILRQQSAQSHYNTIFVYMRSGSIIEVHPATRVQLAEDFLEILDHHRLVAAYPRERVLFASDGLVEPQPLDKAYGC